MLDCLAILDWGEDRPVLWLTIRSKDRPWTECIYGTAAIAASHATVECGSGCPECLIVNAANSLILGC